MHNKYEVDRAEWFILHIFLWVQLFSKKAFFYVCAPEFLFLGSILETQILKSKQTSRKDSVAVFGLKRTIWQEFFHNEASLLNNYVYYFWARIKKKSYWQYFPLSCIGQANKYIFNVTPFDVYWLLDIMKNNNITFSKLDKQ